MTNLGAGFPVGSPEATGPPPPSSSGPPGERDRYAEFWLACFTAYSSKARDCLLRRCFSVFCSRQLMPPPPLPVNVVRPRMEERRAPLGPVGKGTVIWFGKIPPAQSHSP